MLRQDAAPLVVLIVAMAGIVFFSRGLRVVDTVGLLVSGFAAGASLAAMATGRRRAP